jgi:hypothetical protein
MLALCHRREVPRRYRLRATLPLRPLAKEGSPDLEPFPVVLAKTQCPICIGGESNSYEERMGCFCRVSKMRDHVERIHLRGVVPEEKISCRHPVCKSQGLVLEGPTTFQTSRTDRPRSQPSRIAELHFFFYVLRCLDVWYFCFEFVLVCLYRLRQYRVWQIFLTSVVLQPYFNCLPLNSLL